MSGRQSGRTSKQMKIAPQGATFIWCNDALRYPIELANALGRSDLRIEPLSWLRPDRVYPLGLRVVVIDHAARLDANQCMMLQHLECHGVEIWL